MKPTDDEMEIIFDIKGLMITSKRNQQPELFNVNYYSEQDTYQYKFSTSTNDTRRIFLEQ